MPEKQKAVGALMRDAGKEVENGVRDLGGECILRHFRKAAMLEYLIMRCKGSFGSMGESKVRISFCRNIQDIPVQEAIDEMDLLTFDCSVDQYEAELGSPTLGLLRRHQEENPLILFGLPVPHWDVKRLQRYIGYLGVPWVLVVTDENGSDTDFIIAAVHEERKLGRFKVLVLGKELVRSPWKYLSEVGFTKSDEGSLIVRRESCEYLFVCKWDIFFPDTEFYHSRRDPISAIDYGLRRKTLRCLGAADLEGYKRIRPDFIEHLVESVSWNLAGREMIRSDPRNLEIGKPISFIVGGDDEVPQAIDSILADWMCDSHVPATMGCLADRRESSSEWAEAIVCSLMSDYFFVNEAEEIMPLTTDLSQTMGLALVDRNGIVDLARIPDLMPEVQDFLFREKRKFNDTFLEAYRQTRCKVGKTFRDLPSAEAVFRARWLKGTGRPMDKEAQTSYPVRFWEWVGKNDPKALKALRVRIDAGTSAFRSSLLEWAREHAGATMKDDTVRDFIVRRYIEAGIAVVHPRIDWELLAGRLRDRLGFGDAEYGIIVARIRKIASDKLIWLPATASAADVPFVKCLQEMMRATGWGDIGDLGSEWGTVGEKTTTAIGTICRELLGLAMEDQDGLPCMGSSWDSVVVDRGFLSELSARWLDVQQK